MADDPQEREQSGDEVNQVKGQQEDGLVQYVVVRKDLLKALNWPVGSVIAQGCHACVAAIAENLNDLEVQQYTSAEALGSMHKVVLEVKNEGQLLKLSGQLNEADILHRLWLEMPEEMPTCLATKPYRRSQVAQHFKKCNLFR